MKSTRVTALVEMNTSSDRVAQLRAILEEMVRHARAETGCELYEMYEDRDRAGQFIFFEHWSDEASLDVHTSTPHFELSAKAIQELVTSPIKVTHFKRIL